MEYEYLTLNSSGVYEASNQDYHHDSFQQDVTTKKGEKIISVLITKTKTKEEKEAVAINILSNDGKKVSTSTKEITLPDISPGIIDNGGKRNLKRTNKDESEHKVLITKLEGPTMAIKKEDDSTEKPSRRKKQRPSKTIHSSTVVLI